MFSSLAARRREIEPSLRRSKIAPKRFYEDEIPLYEPDVTNNFVRGTITAEFDVTRSGRSINIKLVESQPAGLTKFEKRLVRAIKSVMHRPRMENGSTVDTRQLTYVYQFLYRESDSQN